MVKILKNHIGRNVFYIKAATCRNEYLILLAIVIFSLLFHLIGCFYLYDFANDEGGWLINAKNKVLFNTFSLEGVYYTALSPLNTFLFVLIFKIFGPSIWISRYISIIFSVATLVLFFLFVNKHYTLKIAAFAAFVIAVNAVYNRLITLGYLESKTHFLLILTLLFCFSSKQWLRRLSFLPFSFCLGFKPNLIYFTIPVLYALSIDVKEKTSPALSPYRKSIVNIVIFLLSTSLITGIFFYLAYIFDPLHFVSWGLKTHISGRFNIYAILKDPLENGFLPFLWYFFIHAPVTSLCFLWGIATAIRERRKTSIDIFLLLWIFSEIGFYAFQPFLPERYILDLMFPFSIFSAKAILKTMSDKNLFYTLKSYLLALIIILIAIIQIVGSFYFFLILKPERPAIEVSRWLIKESSRYETVLAPPQVAIGLPKKSLVASSHFTINNLLSSSEIRYPLLCILQRTAAINHPEDDIFLKDNGKFIKKIGYFWIYEILN